MFLAILAEVCTRFNWVLHAYCLMGNHYHLLVETPDGNLSKGMQYLNGLYTQRFNRIHQHVGHVFQGRYKAILVDKDSYLLELMRYIVLNPCRAGLVEHPGDWAWSSYQATAGLAEAPTWLATDWTLTIFAQRGGEGGSAYQQFVAAGIDAPRPWVHLKEKLYLGSDAFVSELQGKSSPGGVPKPQCRPIPESLESVFLRAASRDEAILIAYQRGCFTLQQIGDHVGLHYSRVSRIVKIQRQKAGV